MPIRFECPCGQPITARDDYAGKRVQCNKCKKKLTVPAVSGPSAPTKIRPRSSAMETVTPGAEAAATVTPGSSPAPVAVPVPTPQPGPLVPPIAQAMPVHRAPATVVAPSTGIASPGIRFRCACGATYQARMADAGQPARCARCSDILFIPPRHMAPRPGTPAPVVAQDQPDRYRHRKD